MHARIFLLAALGILGCKGGDTSKPPTIATAPREIYDDWSRMTVSGPMPDWPQGAGQYGESKASLLLRTGEPAKCGDPDKKDPRCLDPSLAIDAALVFEGWNVRPIGEQYAVADFQAMADNAIATRGNAVELNTPRLEEMTIVEPAAELAPGVWSYTLGWKTLYGQQTYQVEVYMRQAATGVAGLRCTGVTRGKYVNSWKQLRDICRGLKIAIKP